MSAKDASKFSVKAGPWAGALKRLSAVVKRGTTLPVLSSVHVSLDRGELWMTVTDLDHAWRERVPLESGEGSAAVAGCFSHSMLSRLAGGFGAGDVLDLEVKGGDEPRLGISGRGRSAAFPGLPAAEFPEGLFGRLDEAKDLSEVDVAALSAGLGAVLHAVSTDSTRYMLNGVYAAVRDGVVEMVGTDGRRLAVTKVPRLPESVLGKDGALLLPTFAVMSLRAMLDGASGVRMGALNDGWVGFLAADRAMVCRQMEGNFPRYAPLITEDRADEVVVEVDADELADAAKWLSMVGDEKALSEGGQQIVLVMDSVGARLQRESRDGAVGEVALKSAKAVGKGEVTMALGSVYLAQAAAAMVVDVVTLRARTPLDPLRMLGGDSLEVIMPMRVV